MSVPARSSSEWRRLTMIELPLAIKAVVARFAVCRSFTKRKNMLRHARNVHEVLVEVKKPMNCYGCGVGLSSLEKYVEHHIEEHKFATEYVQQPFHNDKDIVLLIGQLLNNIVDFSNQWRNQNVCPNC
uniref:Uncharacterized protein n=1 Tax=Rhipicephalus appendiculatus TaxID=34631 RepID=A0A131Z2Q1_RHIAP